MAPATPPSTGPVMDNWVGCGEAVMVVGGDVETVVGKVCDHIYVYVALIR